MSRFDTTPKATAKSITLEYGTYVEGMTREVFCSSDPNDPNNVYYQYVQRLNELRSLGCTITPRAFIPEAGVMWIYIPTDPQAIEIHVMPDSPYFLPSTVQVISSLLNMYRARYDFTLTTFDDICELVCTLAYKGHVVVEALNTPTVPNAPFVTLYSDKFVNPIISKYLGTYTCLRMIPFMLIREYRFSILIGTHNLSWDSDDDQLIALVEGTLPGVTRKVYESFAAQSLDIAIQSSKGIKFNPGIEAPRAVVIPADAIVVFKPDAKYTYLTLDLSG